MIKLINRVTINPYTATYMPVHELIQCYSFYRESVHQGRPKIHTQLLLTGLKWLQLLW